MLDDDQLAAAVSYVTSHGNEVQRARLNSLLGLFPLARDHPAYDLWLAGQNADGGWRAGDMRMLQRQRGDEPSSIMETVHALRIAVELRLPVYAEVRVGLLWLGSRQQASGAFADPREVINARFDIAPNDQDSCITAFSTAVALHMLDFWVAAVPTYDRVRDRAYIWLRRNALGWAEHYRRTVWLAGACALRREGTNSGIGVTAMADLSYRLSIHPERFWSTDLADIAVTLIAAGWPKNESPVNTALRLLERRQLPDGSFASPNAQEDPVDATLGAIRAFRAPVP